MSPRPRLPWHVRWASRLLSERERTEFIAELMDMYHRRLRRSDRAAADAWLRREGRRAFVHLLRLRLGDLVRARITRNLRGLSDTGSVRPRQDRTHPAPGERIMNVAMLFRFGARRLWASMTSTMTIVLTVALGLGGTTAAFAIVHGVLLEPLPYEDAHNLMWVYTSWPDGRE